jgi:hypothetical protein
MDLETTLTAPSLPLATTPATGSWPAYRSHAEPAAADAYVAQRAERGSWATVLDDDVLTEPCHALTAEIEAYEAPTPLAEPLTGAPAYLVEACPASGQALLVAVRATLRDALAAADAVHPGVADVVVRELPLPCDASSLLRAMGTMRAWTREADGLWWPPLPDLL